MCVATDPTVVLNAVVNGDEHKQGTSQQTKVLTILSAKAQVNKQKCLPFCLPRHKSTIKSAYHFVCQGTSQQTKVLTILYGKAQVKKNKSAYHFVWQGTSKKTKVLTILSAKAQVKKRKCLPFCLPRHKSINESAYHFVCQGTSQ